MSVSHSERNKRKYFEWLVSIVGMDFNGFEYRFLLNRLFKREFYWTVANDDNRATDGVYLRAQWLFRINDELVENGQLPVASEDLDGPCSVLEMMIGLAWRMEEDVMMNDLYGNRTFLWFWSMMMNMFDSVGGLETLKDDIWVYDPDCETRCYYAVGQMLDRKYNFDGSDGGLFILERPNMDMRQVEIWSQAMSWLSENFIDEE